MIIKKSIQLTSEPFNDLVQNGKAVDFRLDEPQWQGLKINDYIEFWEDFTGWQTEPSPESRKVTVQITDIFRAKSFSDLITFSKKDGFFTDVDSEEITSNLRQWWTEDKEKRAGVLGLKVQLI